MARTFVWLMLLLNALYWSWAQGWLLPYGFGPLTQREPQRLAQQILPEAITLVSQAEARRKPLAGTSENAPCLQTGLLDEAQTAVVRTYLASSWPADSWVFQAVTAPERWLVYMGKYANLAYLEKKRAEMAAIQISTEPVTSVALSPGLSLGAYPTQAQANTALQALSHRGVRTARVVQEPAAGPGLRLRLPAVSAAQQARLPELKAVLPSAALESCTEPEVER